MTMINVYPVPAFNDNYLWLIQPQDQQQTLVVDPGDAAPILAALEQRKLSLAAILITHHHADHTGGIEQLLEHFPVPVYGPASDKIPQITHTLQDCDSIEALPGVELQVLAVPGHTLDHIAYYIEPEQQSPLLFCGDTLFAGGCGRLFEGSPTQMHHSLQKLASLDDSTQVFCAHEYTLANLSFAQAVEPDNQQLLARIENERHKRQQGLFTVPSTIAREKASNPFLRCHVDNVVRAALQYQGSTEALTEADVFATIRRWKDNF